MIHLHRVIHDQVHRHLRVDFFGISAQPDHGGAHRRQIDDRGHAREILKDDPGRQVGDLFGGGSLVPGGECAYVIFGDAVVVYVPQYVFEEHADADRQTIDPADAGGTELGQAMERIRFTSGLQGRASVKTILVKCHRPVAPIQASPDVRLDTGPLSDSRRASYFFTGRQRAGRSRQYTIRGIFRQSRDGRPTLCAYQC